MKYKRNDIVYYDDARGLVIAGEKFKLPYTGKISAVYEVHWHEGGVSYGVWESDLMSESEYLDLLDECR